MRILVVTNVYPPQFVGGYELGCRDVLEGLKERGHEVCVLTSWYGSNGPAIEGNVHRVLEPSRILTDKVKIRYPKIRDLLVEEWKAQRAFRKVCRKFQPDIVYFWNMGGLPVSLVYIGEQMLQSAVAYYISDDWPSSLKQNHWYIHWALRETGSSLKRSIVALLNQTGLMPFYDDLVLSNAQLTSRALAKQLAKSGVQFAEETIIPWGVDCSKFNGAKAYILHEEEKPVRALCTGQIMPHKGIHTVISAMNLLHRAGIGSDKLTLTIVGGSLNPEYEREVKETVCKSDLAEMVTFTGKMPREEMPKMYQTHDVYIFPSIFEEPFSIALVEAMASGMAVVCTTTGGSAEIAENYKNCLTFAKDDARACAECIKKLIEDPLLLRSLGNSAQEQMNKDFTLDGMVARIENHLLSVVAEKSEKQHKDRTQNV